MITIPVQPLILIPGNLNRAEGGSAGCHDLAKPNQRHPRISSHPRNPQPWCLCSIRPRRYLYEPF